MILLNLGSGTESVAVKDLNPITQRQSGTFRRPTRTDDHLGVNPHDQRALATELAAAAWIMSGFDTPHATMNILEPKFTLGKTFATAAVTAWAERHEIDLSKLMWRHNCGEWGDLCEGDKTANDQALEYGDRILSAYQVADRRIFIITEHDCSQTTIMLASEY